MGCKCEQLCGTRADLVPACIGSVWIFENLSPEERQALAGGAVRKVYGQREVIFSQGEKADQMFLIKAGRVKLIKSTREGSEIILDFRKGGDFIGENILHEEIDYPLSAICLTETVTCGFTKKIFEKLVLDYPSLKGNRMPGRALKEKAVSLGAHLVGVAPVERMENAPPHLHLKRLLPEARSLVSLALRINRGVQQLHLHGVSPMPFSRFAGLEPKTRLDGMALDVSNFLEDLGFISLPVPANEYYYQEKGLGEISHKHVAMAAGLGRLGRGGFLVTPQ